MDVVNRLREFGQISTQAELSKIERGFASRWHVADTAYLSAIAEILGVEPVWLVLGAEQGSERSVAANTSHRVKQELDGRERLGRPHSQVPK